VEMPRINLTPRRLPDSRTDFPFFQDFFPPLSALCRLPLAVFRFLFPSFFSPGSATKRSKVKNVLITFSSPTLPHSSVAGFEGWVKSTEASHSVLLSSLQCSPTSPRYPSLSPPRFFPPSLPGPRPGSTNRTMRLFSFLLLVASLRIE